MQKKFSFPIFIIAAASLVACSNSSSSSDDEGNSSSSTNDSISPTEENIPSKAVYDAGFATCTADLQDSNFRTITYGYGTYSEKLSFTIKGDTLYSTAMHFDSTQSRASMQENCDYESMFRTSCQMEGDSLKEEFAVSLDEAPYNPFVTSGKANCDYYLEYAFELQSEKNDYSNEYGSASCNTYTLGDSLAIIRFEVSKRYASTIRFNITSDSIYYSAITEYADTLSQESRKEVCDNLTNPNCDVEENTVTVIDSTARVKKQSVDDYLKITCQELLDKSESIIPMDDDLYDDLDDDE